MWIWAGGQRRKPLRRLRPQNNVLRTNNNREQNRRQLDHYSTLERRKKELRWWGDTQRVCLFLLLLLLLLVLFLPSLCCGMRLLTKVKSVLSSRSSPNAGSRHSSRASLVQFLVLVVLHSAVCVPLGPLVSDCSGNIKKRSGEPRSLRFQALCFQSLCSSIYNHRHVWWPASSQSKLVHSLSVLLWKIYKFALFSKSFSKGLTTDVRNNVAHQF